MAHWSFVFACVLLAVNLGWAGWLVADHYGFLRRFLTSGVMHSKLAPLVAALAFLPFTMGRVVLTWCRRRRGESPRLRKQLARFGDPDEVAAELTREIDDDAVTEHMGPVALTRSWIVRDDEVDFGFARLDDVVWAYASATTFRVAGVPVAKARQLQVHTSDGRSPGPALTTQCHEDDAAAVLEALRRRAPWVEIGFDEATRRRWLTDPGSMIAERDRRRAASARDAEERAAAERDATGR